LQNRSRHVNVQVPRTCPWNPALVVTTPAGRVLPIPFHQRNAPGIAGSIVRARRSPVRGGAVFSDSLHFVLRRAQWGVPSRRAPWRHHHEIYGVGLSDPVAHLQLCRQITQVAKRAVSTWFFSFDQIAAYRRLIAGLASQCGGLYQFKTCVPNVLQRLVTLTLHAGERAQADFSSQCNDGKLNMRTIFFLGHRV